MKYLAIGVLLGLLALVSAMEHEDAVMAEAEYCDMVKMGYWPAFKNNIDC